MSQAPIHFYRDKLSGHCHRVELLLSMLQIRYQAIDVDIARGDLKRPEFLALNRFAQVPVIVDQGAVVADSTAILVYLAMRYGGADWLPADPLGAARVQRWLAAASGVISHSLRRVRLMTAEGARFVANDVVAESHAFLHVMEDELFGRLFLAADHATIADLACYSYVAHAPEGHVSLAVYPNVRSWLARVEALPRFVAMPMSRGPRLAGEVRAAGKGVGAWLRRWRK